jgi:hypothetical protein
MCLPVFELIYIFNCTMALSWLGKPVAAASGELNGLRPRQARKHEHEKRCAFVFSRRNDCQGGAASTRAADPPRRNGTHIFLDRTIALNERNIGSSMIYVKFSNLNRDGRGMSCT